mmetsp:Transcript_22767/g.33725  ORF Transcript_22767/g.33725 Transcript_22767/m.33725 type:complete len:218 (+) Transcript_22767:97-750(+)
MTVIESNEEIISEAPLSPVASATTAATINTTTSADAKGQENTASEETEVDELLDELEQAEPSESDIAVSKLKESTNKLTSAIKSVGSDLDNKFHIIDHARSVDSQFSVSKTVGSATATIGNLLGSLQLGEKANFVMNQDAVKNVSNTLNDTLEKTGIKGVVGRGVKEVQTLDEEHKVSGMAVGALTSGIDWVAGTLEASSGRERAQQGNEFEDDEWE